MSNLIALADCDNFYASCERIFCPKLRNKPVIVLSNNDGCVIARSQEVKDRGIKMGTPYYQIKGQIEKEKIAVFSSNYELYGDISSRVMNTLAQLSPNIEIYSIDEAFIEMAAHNAEEICTKVVSSCRQWLSVPVKVGVSSTKTLAKVATQLVKQQKISSKYKILIEQCEIDSVLKIVKVEDIWGVGHKTAYKLNQIGCRTASELISLNDDYIRRNFGVTLVRTAMELRGEKCFDLETNPPPKKNMCYSRSFGECVTEFNELRESITSYATNAAENLRADKLKAQSVSVFILTNRFNEKVPQYANSVCLSFPIASNDTPVIVNTAIEGLKKIYRQGFAYKKSGILLNDLISEDLNQLDLFVSEDPKQKAISRVMDAINAKYGRDSIVIASSGLKKQKWKMSRKLISQKYTSQWDELLKI